MKYKKCCLTSDEVRLGRERTTASANFVDQSPADTERMLDKLEVLARNRPEMRDLLESTRSVKAYLKELPRIQEASSALVKFQDEYERTVVQDQEALIDRAENLFAEKAFDSMRFTADDVQRAFEQVGYVGALVSEKSLATIEAAILFLADEAGRLDRTRQLALLLPNYVDARPLDACLIRDCLVRTSEDLDHVNPFLYQMFLSGYEAWTNRRRELDMAALREAGVDVDELTRMTDLEREEWLSRQLKDPEQADRMEKILDSDPARKRMAENTTWSLMTESVNLLERDDAAGLLLSSDELGPWLPRIQEVLARITGPVPPEQEPSESDKAALGQAATTLLEEMVAEIFTDVRLEQLVNALRAYRHDRQAADDFQAAGLAYGAIACATEAGSPNQARFLALLCYRSIERLARAVGPVEK